jgi:nucleotide-binding universal stress UspA family protein
MALLVRSRDARIGGTHKPSFVEVRDVYHVLVPVDESESRARTQAEAVAALPAASEAVEATLLHVFTDNPSGASVTQLGAVRRAREVLEDADVEVRLDEASGDPAEEVVERARELDVDCICVAGRKRSPAGKALFGSVSQDVILDSDRAVLFAHGE